MAFAWPTSLLLHLCVAILCCIFSILPKICHRSFDGVFSKSNMKKMTGIFYLALVVEENLGK